MPPKRLSKPLAIGDAAIWDPAKQRRIESESTSSSPAAVQFNPSEPRDAITTAISGALQSASTVNASQFQPGASSTSLLQVTYTN